MEQLKQQTRSFLADGQTLDIPLNDVDSFLSDTPHAKEIMSFTTGNDTFDIPIDEVPDFLNDVPDAKPFDYHGEASHQETTASERLHTSLPYVHIGGEGREPVIVGAVNSKENIGYQEKVTGKGTTDHLKMDAISPQEDERGVKINPDGLSFQGNGYDAKEVAAYASVENRVPEYAISEKEVQGKLDEFDKRRAENPDDGFIDRIFTNSDEEKEDLARNLYDKSLKNITSVKGTGNTGAGDALSDRNFWTLGSTDLSAMIYLKRISKKIDKGETLNDSEKVLLDAWSTNEEVKKTYDASDASTGYKVGKNVTDMVPWLIQFASTRGIVE